MSIEITIQGGTSKKLLTGGKYCPEDIVVTAEGGGGSAPDPREQYQRVEYIESAAEETYPYIITDFYADNESGVEIIASFPVFQDRVPMGSRENGDATRFYCVYPLSVNSIYYGFNTGSTISCKLTADTIYRLQTNFLNSRLVNVYGEDGTRKGGGAISSTLTPAHTAPVSILHPLGVYRPDASSSCTVHGFPVVMMLCGNIFLVIARSTPSPVCMKNSQEHS